MVVLFCAHRSIAQLDSLRRNLELSPFGAKRVEALLSLADFLKSYDYFEAESMALEALSLAESLNDNVLRGKANRTAGLIYWLHGQYTEGIPALDQARKILSEEEELAEYARATNTLGLLYYYQAQYDTAALLLEEALNVHMETGDTSQIARVANNLGLLYSTRGDFVKSTHYLIMSTRYEILYTSLRDRDGAHRSQKSLQNSLLLTSHIVAQNRKKLEIVKMTNDPLKIASCYAELGKIYQIQENKDSAIYYFSSAGKVYQEENWERRYLMEMREIARTYQQSGDLTKALVVLNDIEDGLKKHMALATYADVLGDLFKIHMSLQNYALAEMYAIRSYEQAKSLGHRASMSRFIRDRSLVYFEKNEPARGLAYLIQSYDLAKEIGSFSQTKLSAQLLYEYYKKKEDAELALRFHEEVVEMERLMNEAESRRQVLEFEVKSDLEARANLIEKLNQEKQITEKLLSSQRIVITLTIVLVVILIVFLIVLLNRFKKINVLKGNIESQNELLKSQNQENVILMNEIHHRVKNNLQMIGSLLSMQNRRLTDGVGKEVLNLTRRRIQSIGLVHEHLYKHEKLSKISLEPYVKNLAEIVARDAQISVQMDFHIEEIEVDVEAAIPIALILNELLTNALKYGKPASGDPKVHIQMKVMNDHLYLTVEDNGPGCKQMNKSFGWTIIQAFITSFKGNYEIDSHKGMRIVIIIPLKSLYVPPPFTPSNIAD